MTEQFYLNLNEFMINRPAFSKFCVILGKVITFAVYIFYPFLLFFSWRLVPELFLKTLLLPAVSFILVSIFRKLYNAPRPYEKFNITPLYNKKTSGKSFPSRHTFSIFIIGFVTFNFSFLFGVSIMALGIILAITRVLCGVHFIKDVIAGFFAAFIFAVLGALI